LRYAFFISASDEFLAIPRVW